MLLQTANGLSAPAKTVESLAAKRERLKELREHCEADRAKLGDALCNAVSEAAGRHSVGDGKVPYTPPQGSPKF
ncbi:entry exclusion lipoprotein TrbK [Xanthomonas hortorum]|uniref:Entry exclusion lipoprotein TrbK n=1 Tax=Xanthomonas hortorum TaxID=56454 RepID=A0AA47EWD5_9XANT|nr:entry exclusion lipoprotein TrbK [Xanthomonas hortorum]WAH66595.1 entry exclusion lipoprotein TrbK [Xanthomonas hortorum]